MATPKLRFKEFKGEWLQADIQALVDEKIIDKPMDGNHGEIHPTSADYVDDGIPFVMATDVIDGKVHLDKSKKIKKSQADGLRKGFSVGGDILLTHKATIGNVAKVPELKTPYIMLTPQVTYYRVLNKAKLIPDFIKSTFEAPIFQNELLALCTGATRLYIGISEQRKLPFSYPSKEEQTKVAAFLSAVDEKISQLTQKYQLLSQYKQGMMQKLFSQQIRFKADDGSEFGEWEENVIQYFMDKNYIIDQMDGNHGELYPKSEEFSEKGIPYIGATDFSNGQVNFLSTKKLPIERALKFKKGIAKDGDILFAHNATVGPVALLKTDLEFVILSTTATYYRCNPQKLKNIYLKSILESDYFKKQYVGIMSQSTRNQVPITTQRKLKLLVPSLEEQTKIANFLSAIDQKIEVVSQQIEQAKTWKKGLLQQMFV